MDYIQIPLAGGGSIGLRDDRPDLVDSFIKTYRASMEKNRIFHDKLMSLGVKAYRCNDGWVDREKHHITFFDSEAEYGYYWGSTRLKDGDLIFIGNRAKGGQFAKITGTISKFCGKTYSYELMDKFLEGC